MRSIENLLKEQEHVWFYVAERWKKEFYEELISLGMRFISGSNITQESIGVLMGISNDGTGAILKSFAEWGNKTFISYLQDEGFEKWSKSKYYPSVDWLYVNLNSKRYAFGIPGIPVTKPFGNHAVTIDEFKVIYEIYRKYEDKLVLKNS